MEAVFSFEKLVGPIRRHCIIIPLTIRTLGCKENLKLGNKEK